MKLQSMISAMVVLCLCFSSFASAAVETPKSVPPATVYVTKVNLSEIFDFLSYPARIIPKINTTILSEIDGVVSRIVTPLGHSVTSGQRLMILNHTDPVYQYAPVSVVTPVKGIVSVVEVTEGSQIAKGQKLISVTNPSVVRITIEIPAQDLEVFHQGMKGEFRLTGRTDAISVQVRGISPFVDPSTGTATAELELAPGGKTPLLMRPGLMGQVTFKTNLHSGIIVPDHAIFYKANDTYIRLIENGKVKQVPVQLGKKQRGSVEILSGIKPETTVVERASRFIADGETVTIEGSAPEAPSSPVNQAG